MTSGILFMVFVALSIATIGIVQFFIFMKKRDTIALNIHMQSLFFALFWFVMGFVWLFAGISDYLSWSGRHILAYDMAIATQFAVGLAVILVYLFFYSRIMERKALYMIFTPLFALTLIFVWSVFSYGLTYRPLTFFTNQFILSDTSRLLFALLAIPSITFAILFLLRGATNMQLPVIERRFLFSASFSLLLLSLGGSIEQYGEITNYMIPIARLCALVAAMAGYVATTNITQVVTERRQLVI